MSRVLVKICGQTRSDMARLCAELGADMLGFIFHHRSPRCTAPALPASLYLPGVLKVGVFVDQSVNETLALMRTGRLDVAQLHGGQDHAFCRALADVLGPERIMKVVWPEKAATLAALQDELDRFAPLCGRFLADAGKDGGGHGRGIAATAAHLLREARFPRPWLLAGGLSPQTVGPAFSHFQQGGHGPAGLDLNSGVESAPGVKDETLLRAAFSAINALNAA